MGVKRLWTTKSLELAFAFEMNMFFFGQIVRFISSAISQFIDHTDSRSNEKQQQAERHHREKVSAPEMEKLHQYREQFSFALLKFISSFGIEIILIADMHTLLPSPNNTLTSVFSTFCSRCTILNIKQSQITMTSLYALGILSDFAFHFLLYMSCSWACAIRLTLYLGCLGRCYHYIYRNLSYAVIATTLIDLNYLLRMASAIVIINIFKINWSANPNRTPKYCIGSICQIKKGQIIVTLLVFVTLASTLFQNLFLPTKVSSKH